MKRFLLLLTCLYLLGCEAPRSNSNNPPPPNFIQGVPVAYQVLHECSSYNQIFIEFSDGRVIKFRHRDYAPVSFTKGSLCRIYFDGMEFGKCEIVEERRP